MVARDRRSASTRSSRTAASPAATRCGCARRPIAPSLALGLGTHVRVAARRPVPAPGQPARLRHPRRGVARRPARPRRRGRPEPGRPGELLRHAGERLRRASRRTACFAQGRVRPQADGAAAVAAPLQPGASHRGDLHDPEPGGLQPRHRARHGRAPGQRARERHHLEPDQRLDDRARGPRPRTRSSARSSSRASRSSRRRSAASARGRPPNIYAPDVNAPVTGMDVARTGAFTDGTASTAAVSVFDTVDVGLAAAAHRRRARRALRRDASSRATPPASRRPTSRRTTRWSAARSARSTSSPTRATSTSRGAPPRRRRAPRTSR